MAVGSAMTFDNRAMTIIGIMPAFVASSTPTGSLQYLVAAGSR